MCPTCTHPRWGELTKQISCVPITTQEGSLGGGTGMFSGFSSMSASATLTFWRVNIMGDRRKNNYNLEWHSRKNWSMVSSKESDQASALEKLEFALFTSPSDAKKEKNSVFSARKPTAKPQRVTQLRHVLSANSVALHSARPHASWSITRHDCSRWTVSFEEYFECIFCSWNMELSASLILYIFCILIYKVYLQILHISKAVTVLCMHKMAGDLKIFWSPNLKK